MLIYFPLLVILVMIDTAFMLLIPILAVFANVTVPVVPDPAYIQSFDNSSDGPAIPADIMSIAGVLGTAGLGYLFKKQKDKSDTRGGKYADVISKLASNDQSTDEDNLEIVYAISVMADILSSDPVWKAKMDAYMTKDGTTASALFKSLPAVYNQAFESYYKKTDIPVTCKDPIVNTLNKVEQKITPTK